MKHAGVIDIPADCKRLMFGKLLPDDLLFAYPSGPFLRHDDPSWNSRVEYASDAFLAIRKRHIPLKDMHIVGIGEDDGLRLKKIDGEVKYDPKTGKGSVTIRKPDDPQGSLF